MTYLYIIAVVLVICIGIAIYIRKLKKDLWG